VRPRKFYATRHSFISAALTRGVNLKWLADYCGTSVDMIERHYGRCMQDDHGQLVLFARGPEQLATRAAAGAESATFRATFRGALVSTRTGRAEGGRFELGDADPAAHAGNPLPTETSCDSSTDESAQPESRNTPNGPEETRQTRNGSGSRKRPGRLA